MAHPNMVAIDTRTDDPLAVMINNKLKNLTPQVANTDRPSNIFRVPSYIREDNKNFYEPRMVSIGPYHRGSKHLKCMEEQKWVYLHKLLSYTDVPLSKFIEVLREHEGVARRYYYETINMDSDQFVEMLLLDACFIIELAANITIQDEPDVLSEIGWYIPHIKSDILMLENQIPFFVLQRVFDLFLSTNDTCDSSILFSSDSTSQDIEHPKNSLFCLLIDFLQHENETLSLPNADQNFEHLLSFYYHCYMSTQKLPGNWQMKKMKTALPFISSIKRVTMRRRRHQAIIKVKRKPRMIPCATELKEAGITFKKTKSESIFNVDFSDGVLRIPFTPIEETTRTELMNLIAFEQCCGQKERPLSSYAVFMDCIVNTPRDVLILQQHGIIENKLADEKAAAVFFNQLRYCSYVDYENHHLAELFRNVKKYCDSRWHKYMARLNRDYFSNPWSIMSFLAAIALLVLATLQTVFTVLQYVNS